MSEGVLQRLRNHVVSAHQDEGGAIIMLALAGVLILFMTAMVMYDAGESAREKAELQTATDTAALSHAVTKARSMNMIAYANTSKRILYGYNTIYVAAYLALVETVGIYYALSAAEFAAIGSACLIGWCPFCIPEPICAFGHLVAGIDTLVHAIEGTIQLVMESIEAMFNNGNTLMGIGSSGDPWRSVKEMAALDFYQEYTVKITGWWSWGEATTRGVRNQASIMGTWPPPPGSFTRIRGVASTINSALSMFGMGFSEPYTDKQDALPVEREPDLPILAGLAGHMNMCFKTLTSLDFWALQYYYQHHRASEGYWDDTTGPRRGGFRPFRSGSGRHPSPQTLVTTLTIAQLPIGCLLAAATFGTTGIPFEISVEHSNALPGSNAEASWVMATSNYAFGYKTGGGRFDDEGKRKKLAFMKQDYGFTGGNARGFLYRNDGYWAVSRAEMVYSRSMVGSALSGPSGNTGPGMFSSLTSIVSGVLDAPDLWAPRYTARLRPVNLVGEEVDDMSKMAFETIPYMVFAAPLSAAYGDGGSFSNITMPSIDGIAGSAMNFARDAAFFWRSGRGFTSNRMANGGMPK